MTRFRVQIVCGALALVVGGLTAWAAAGAAGGDIRALVRMSRDEPIGAHVASEIPEFRFVAHDARYDGRYFYAIALDPLALGREHALIDLPAYRYGHPGYGWVASVMSLGNAAALPLALLFTGLTGLVAAAVAVSFLARELGASGWAGLLVAFNPGLLFGVATDTSEPLGAAAVALGVLWWVRREHAAAAIALACACLIKEPLVLVPLGLALWEVVQARRGPKVPDLARRLALLATGPLALAAWFVYLKVRLGEWSFAAGPPNLTLPLTGWIESLKDAAVLSLDSVGHQVGAAALPLLVAAAGVVAYGMARSVRLRNPGQAIFLLSGLLVACFADLALVYPKDLIRNLAIPLTFLPWVLWDGRRAGL